MTRIAVIGAGNIGGTLGDVWRRARHDVTFGVRDATERSDDARTYAAPSDAIQSAHVVVFAVPGAAMDETVRELGPALGGKIVIDATNRLDRPKAHSEALAALASDETQVFRAFNSLGWENFRDPKYGDDVADMFFSGPNTSARSTVEALIGAVGLRPIYTGTDPEIPDAVLRVWMALTRGQGMSRDLAFKVLTR